MNDPRGYDLKQLGAVLTYCLVCHRHYFMTGPPRTTCLRCAQQPKRSASGQRRDRARKLRAARAHAR